MSERSMAALRERVKELTCLYGIARAAERPDLSLAQLFQTIVELLPPAWQYPEIASARITLDEQTYSSVNFGNAVSQQSAGILIKGETRGMVEVRYSAPRPALDEGPFLRWERNLINAVAREIALITERRHTEEAQRRLQDQLLHADRLATIGQLAAGVAHELNEPLGNILGFAELASDCEGLPGQALTDLRNIVDAVLFARDIIRKLLIFARQAPSDSGPIALNHVIESGLFLVESQCAKAGIELRRMLDPTIPQITADPGQVRQVLVNLAVNAIQAMPDGGVLTIRTGHDGDHVELSVEDTGKGMSDEVQKRVFDPFFTTKDVDEGTGLGLAVVHGIVASHKGTITVQSAIDVGTRFELRFPCASTDQTNETNRVIHGA
jgi:two-component system NtrC family sensor kinase